MFKKRTLSYGIALSLCFSLFSSFTTVVFAAPNDVNGLTVSSRADASGDSINSDTSTYNPLPSSCRADVSWGYTGTVGDPWHVILERSVISNFSSQVATFDTGPTTSGGGRFIMRSHDSISGFPAASGTTYYFRAYTENQNDGERGAYVPVTIGGVGSTHGAAIPGYIPAPSPTNLTVSYVNTNGTPATSPTLSWSSANLSDTSKNRYSGYEIYRNNILHEIITDYKIKTYTDTSANSTTSYTYKVRSFTSDIDCGSSDKNFSTSYSNTITVLPTPNINTATYNGAGSNSITLTWPNVSPTPVNYELWRTSGATNISNLTSCTTTTNCISTLVSPGTNSTVTTTVTGLANSAIYNFKIRAMYGSPLYQASVFSSVKTVSTGIGSPQGFSTSYTISNAQYTSKTATVNLSWNGGGGTRYEVTRSLSPDFGTNPNYQTVVNPGGCSGGLSLACSDPNLPQGKIYYYKLVAYSTYTNGASTGPSTPVFASTDLRIGELLGYANSENIGLISMSCRNTDSCGTVSYGVFNDIKGNLVGYAWSDNIGWIKFGDLSDLPNGTNAKITTNLSRVQGWVQAQAAPDAGDNAGGWNGWINFDGGSGVSIGPFTNGTAYLIGNAAGSEVVGLVDMSGVSLTLPVNSLDFSIEEDGSSPLNTSTSNLIVTSGDDLNFKWTPSGMASCVASGDTLGGVWSGTLDPVVNPDGTTSTLDILHERTKNPIPYRSSPYSFTLTCNPLNGTNPVSKTITVSVTQNTTSFSAVQTNNTSNTSQLLGTYQQLTIPEGARVTLRYSAQNASYCNAFNNGDGTEFDWAGNVGCTSAIKEKIIGPFNNVTPGSRTVEFKLTGKDTSSVDFVEQTINIVVTPPSVALLVTQTNASGAPLTGNNKNSGEDIIIDINDYAQLDWTTSNVKAGTCTAVSNPTSPNGISGKPDTTPDGSRATTLGQFRIQGTYIYNFTGCQTSGGTPISVQQVTITVRAGAPTVSITANPTTVNLSSAQNYSTISWWAENLDRSTCVFSNNSNPVDQNWNGSNPSYPATSSSPGAQRVTGNGSPQNGLGGNGIPLVSYKISCDDPTSSDPAVRLDDVAVVGFFANTSDSINLSANPSTLSLGQSTNLSWTSSGISSCIATSSDNSWTGDKVVYGNESAVPLETGNIVYTLTCKNASNVTLYSQAIVNIEKVDTQKSLLFSASPTQVYPNELGNYYTSLSWQATGSANFSSCSTNGWDSNLKAPASSGIPEYKDSIPVTSSPQTFILTCKPADGTTDISRSVTVFKVIPSGKVRISANPDYFPLSSSGPSGGGASSMLEFKSLFSRLISKAYAAVDPSGTGGSTLTWSSIDVKQDSCSASGDWSGAKSKNGSESVTVSVLQKKFYTYTITCIGVYDDQPVSDSVQIGVGERPTPKDKPKPGFKEI